jgi:hypothetical protein
VRNGSSAEVRVGSTVKRLDVGCDREIRLTTATDGIDVCIGKWSVRRSWPIASVEFPAATLRP